MVRPHGRDDGSNPVTTATPDARVDITPLNISSVRVGSGRIEFIRLPIVRSPIIVNSDPETDRFDATGTYWWDRHWVQPRPVVLPAHHKPIDFGWMDLSSLSIGSRIWTLLSEATVGVLF